MVDCGIFLGESDGSNRRSGLDVDDADAAVFHGEVDFIALDDGVGEFASDGSDGGAVRGVDDADVTAFGFCCV